MEHFTLFFSIIIGLVLGSFYNVCIHRFLLSESIVFPRSHCPKCKHVLSWWENIPLLSYIMLRGKCRNCNDHISVRYPIVESISGLISFLFALKFGLSFVWFAYIVLFGLMIVSSFIDWEALILPNSLMFSGIFLAFSASIFVLPTPVFDSFFGIVIGGGLFFLVQKTYKMIRKKEGLGSGDIKLLAFIGAIVGWQHIPFVLFVSSLIPLILVLLTKSVKENQKFLEMKIPYGPFLSIGAFLCVMNSF